MLEVHQPGGLFLWDTWGGGGRGGGEGRGRVRCREYLLTLRAGPVATLPDPVTPLGIP